MSIKLEIEDIHKKPLIEFYRNRLSEIRVEVAELDKEASGIIKQLAKLEGHNTEVDNFGITDGGQSKKAETMNGYTKSWTWGEKIKYLLRKEGRPLTTGEIADTICQQYEPELVENRSKIVASVSSVLTGKKGTKAFKAVKNESDKTAYEMIK